MLTSNTGNQSASRSWWILALLAAAVATAAFVVFRGALPYFFSQDDFGWLARARGLVPEPLAPWRLISSRGFFAVMNATAGLDPFPYHLASLAAHAGSSLLVGWLLARHVSWPAAWIGAMFFAVHPAHFTAIYWISSIGDVLSLPFALGAVMTARTASPARWWAIPLFLLSLLSKESTLFLPVWIAALAFAPIRPAAAGDTPRSPLGRRSRFRDPLPWVLLAVSATYAVWFRAADVSGSASALPVNAPYAIRFDATALRNLLTYAHWATNAWAPTMRSFTDAVDPANFPYGIAALALWLAGLFSPALRRRGWMWAGGLFLALLAPVLPLRNHTNHYYLYAPLAGVAWCVGALADVAVARLGGRDARTTAAPRRAASGTSRHRSEAPFGSLPGWSFAVTVAALLVANGEALVRKIETHPFVHPELRSDPTVDRARIARNAYDDLARAALPDGCRLWFWSPISIESARQTPPVLAGESYWERNVRSALYDGMAARVLFPSVREARFVGDARPLQASDHYAVYRLDGHLKVTTGAALDSLLRFYPAEP